MPVYYNEATHGPVEYYQEKKFGTVIGKIVKYPNLCFRFTEKSLNKELYAFSDISEDLEYYEIVPPKTGDVIYLLQNNINPNSPHAKKYFKVSRTEDFWASLEPIEGGYQLGIDIRNWVWWQNPDPKTVSPEKPAILIKDGDIITQNGKQFKVTLTEVIPQQKFRIGDVIDGRIILEAEFKNNEWHYLVYDRSSKKNIEIREWLINIKIIHKTFG